MAKGNALLGTLRGSIGDVTFTRVNGKQVSRAKATSVKNPRTSKQVYQRMFFATIGKAKSAMKKIIDHSFEAVRHGSESLNYFQSRNVELMRGKVSFSNELGIWVSNGSYITPKWPYMVANPYRISEGSLPVVNQLKPILSDADIVGKPEGMSFNAKYLRQAIPFFMVQQLFAGTQVRVNSIDRILKASSCKPGDFMTYCFVSRNWKEVTTGENPVPAAFHFVRFKVVQVASNYNGEHAALLTLLPSNIDGRQIVLPDTITTSTLDEAQLETKLLNVIAPMMARDYTEDGAVKPNSLLFAFAVNNLQVADFSKFENEGNLGFSDAGQIIGDDEGIIAGCWVHSRPAANNKLLVSTQDLMMADPTGDVYDYNLGLRDAYDAWQNIASGIGDNTLILEGGNK